MAVVESSRSQEGEGPAGTKKPKTMRSVKLSKSASRKSSTARKDSSTKNQPSQSYWPYKGLLFGKKNSTPKTEQGETKTEENSCSSSSNLDTSGGGSEHHSKLKKLKSRKLSSFASFLRSRSNRGQKSITIPSDEVSVPLSSSLEVSDDVSPEYSNSQESRGRSGTTISSSDDSKTSSSGSQSKSSSSESKSGIVLKKNSSLRKILKKRNSYKLKGNSKPAENESKTPVDSNVEKATCSSTLKNSKFPKRIDLKTSQTVCPYNHCSLHGPHHHHNSNQTPQNRFAYLKRNSENTLHGVQIGIHTEVAAKSANHRKGTGKVVEAEERVSNNVSRNKKRLSLGRVKKEIDFSIELYAQTRSERLAGERVENEDLDLAELLFGVKSQEIKASKTKNPEEQAELSETISQYDALAEPTFRHEKPELNVQPMKADKKISTSDGEISNIDSFEDDSYETKEEITTTRASFSQPSDAYNATTEDKPLLKMSMWHMLHREMVSGLVGLDRDWNPLQQAEEEKQCRLENAKQNHEAHQGSRSENPEVASPEIELQKTFAVNLVRDAVEKILLTEFQDDRFITTNDFTPDEDFPENNPRKIHDDRFFGNDFISDLHYSENNFRKIHGDFDQEFSENDPRDRRADDSSNGGETKPGTRRWSEVKKVVLLQRFVNELEKMKSFDRRRRLGPQPLMEVEREAESVSLRRRGVGERKNAEEWMLDYALRRVVGELAPAQKRKVALLVEAFETVAPP